MLRFAVLLTPAAIVLSPLLIGPQRHVSSTFGRRLSLVLRLRFAPARFAESFLPDRTCRAQTPTRVPRLPRVARCEGTADRGRLRRPNRPGATGEPPPATRLNSVREATKRIAGPPARRPRSAPAPNAVPACSDVAGRGPTWEDGAHGPVERGAAGGTTARPAG